MLAGQAVTTAVAKAGFPARVHEDAPVQYRGPAMVIVQILIPTSSLQFYQVICADRGAIYRSVELLVGGHHAAATSGTLHTQFKLKIEAYIREAEDLAMW